MTVKLRYGITFGKCDSSDWIDWEIELTDEESIAYQDAIDNEISLNEVPDLKEALQRAYEEIEDEEISMGIETEEEFVMECQGTAEIDPDELNDLVIERDPHVLDFFDLTDLDDDELDEWDANDLDELPMIKDILENFEPCSPFDLGWDLHVEFVDPNE